MADTPDDRGTLAARLKAALRALAAAGAPLPADSVLRESATTTAHLAVAQMRPTRWLPDGTPDPTSYAPVPEESP